MLSDKGGYDTPFVTQKNHSTHTSSFFKGKKYVIFVTEYMPDGNLSAHFSQKVCLLLSIFCLRSSFSCRRLFERWKPGIFLSKFFLLFSICTGMNKYFVIIFCLDLLILYIYFCFPRFLFFSFLSALNAFIYIIIDSILFNFSDPPLLYQSRHHLERSEIVKYSARYGEESD